MTVRADENEVFEPSPILGQVLMERNDVVALDYAVALFPVCRSEVESARLTGEIAVLCKMFGDLPGPKASGLRFPDDVASRSSRRPSGASPSISSISMKIYVVGSQHARSHPVADELGRLKSSRPRCREKSWSTTPSSLFAVAQLVALARKMRSNVVGLHRHAVWVAEPYSTRVSADESAGVATALKDQTVSCWFCAQTFPVVLTESVAGQDEFIACPVRFAGRYGEAQLLEPFRCVGLAAGQLIDVEWFEPLVEAVGGCEDRFRVVVLAVVYEEVVLGFSENRTYPEMGPRVSSSNSSIAFRTSAAFYEFFGGDGRGRVLP